MKILFNKYRILIFIFIPVFIFTMVITTCRTNSSITTTGDITNISSFINVENQQKENGSFNSIFVYSTDKSTIFQKWVASCDNDAYVYEPNNNYLLFSDNDLNLMGLIQKNQSIEASVICAYNKAKEIDSSIKIDYSFLGYIVRYKNIEANMFNLGDIIISINGISSTNKNEFINEYKNMLVGSEVIILRDNKEIKLTLDSNNAHYYKENDLYGNISIYEKYDINYETISPKITIGKTNTLGPSAGLLQALSIYNKLIDNDITNGLKISGTGTISENGDVGVIGGEQQKVIAALQNKCDIFICPKGNDESAYKKYISLKNHSRMKFLVVSTFEEALEGIYEITNK